MNEYILFVMATLLALCSMLFSGLAQAVPYPYEFHADAKMAHQQHGPMDSAYGYMYVVADASGRGTINVMFSNGNPDNWARFNARVRFLDAEGKVVDEEMFESWIDAAEGEATERRIARPLSVSDFAEVEVDFFLSDISDRYSSARVSAARLAQ